MPRQTWHSNSLARPSSLHPQFQRPVPMGPHTITSDPAGRALQVRVRCARAPLDPRAQHSTCPLAPFARADTEGRRSPRSQLSAPPFPPSPSRGASRSCASSCKSSTCPPSPQNPDESPMCCDIRSTPLRRRSGHRGRHRFAIAASVTHPPAIAQHPNCINLQHPFETKRGRARLS